MLEEIIIRSLCDTLPRTAVDAAYLFAQTEDNQESVFVTAQQMLEQGVTKEICFVSVPPMSGFPGFQNWLQILMDRGVDQGSIKRVSPFPSDTNMLHTRIEAESMVLFAKQQGYKSMIVTAPPFHQPRAFMAAVTAAIHFYPDLQLYSCAGKTLEWQQEVTHSQGKVQATRARLIEGEIGRIFKYQEQEELAATAIVLDYLNKRNQ